MQCSRTKSRVHFVQGAYASIERAAPKAMHVQAEVSSGIPWPASVIVHLPFLGAGRSVVLAAVLLAGVITAAVNSPVVESKTAAASAVLRATLKVGASIESVLIFTTPGWGNVGATR